MKTIIDEIEVTYDGFDLMTNKYGVKSCIGKTKDGRCVWIAYYSEDNKWEIERYMNDKKRLDGLYINSKRYINWFERKS
jgi:hypothetical protein